MRVKRSYHIDAMICPRCGGNLFKASTMDDRGESHGVIRCCLCGARYFEALLDEDLTASNLTCQIQGHEWKVLAEDATWRLVICVRCECMRIERK